MRLASSNRMSLGPTSAPERRSSPPRCIRTGSEASSSLIIAGARDPVVPPVNAEYLHERLPKSKLDIIDALHSVWEDAADTYAVLVTDWWYGGYAKAGSGSPNLG